MHRDDLPVGFEPHPNLAVTEAMLAERSRNVATTDAYRAALVSLMHTPVRFLGGAVGEVCEKYARDRKTVCRDLLTLEMEHRRERGYDEPAKTDEDHIRDAGRGHLLR